MSIANEYTYTFYIAHFEFKHPVNAAYIITFWSNDPVELKIFWSYLQTTLNNYFIQMKSG